MKQAEAISDAFPPGKDNIQAWGRICGYRVTTIGKYLRILGIDELPQSWLILNGRMTYMGARAWYKKELDTVRSSNNWREVRQRFKPSLGSASMAMRGVSPKNEEMVLLEMYYFGNWSLWLDVKLICRGLLTIAAGRHF